MGCSKYDDFPRHARRDFIKSFAFLPYCGVISSGRRSVDYFRSLGLVNIHCEYNTVDISRVRSLATHPPAPLGASFATRDFIIVARLVEKKNIFTALDAFSKYRLLSSKPRNLRICGSGPLEYALKQHAAKIGVGDSVFFEGFVQTDAVSKYMGTSLALILPSTEEQFGNVVIEAQAMGLPVLISQVCGACDNLVRNWVNGFVFEPDNPEGLAGFMSLIDRDEALWRKLCLGATNTAPKGDVARFVDAVSALTGHKT
jgi:glycosyltransferase involved in cell wall biosynthesis